MGNLVSICSILTCIVTATTFFFARLTDAKKEGEALGKLTSIEHNLNELKDIIKELDTWKQETSIQIQYHEDRINRLHESLVETKNILNKIEDKIA